eukprot:m.181708 g.181708  ORF g.181708 m.181708 type:complete len:301 (-) comp32078_c0_seq1:123-1025(-)
MRTILVTRCSQQFGGSWRAKIPTVATTPHVSLNLPIQQRAEHIKPYRLSTIVVGAGSRHVQVDHSRRWPTLNNIAHVSKRHLHSTAPRYANANRPTQSDRTRHCKKCDSTIRPNAEHNQAICPSCEKILPLDARMNHFELLSLDEAFSIDIKQLENKFKSMQWSLHPDKFALSDDTDKAMSAEWSSAVNGAYRTLRNPLTRATYMLELFGNEIAEDNQLDDFEFLSEIMEWNEEVEDSENDLDRSIELCQDIQPLIAQCIDEITTAFDAKDMASATTWTIKLRYYDNIHATLQDRIPQQE